MFGRKRTREGGEPPSETTVPTVGADQATPGAGEPPTREQVLESLQRMRLTAPASWRPPDREALRRDLTVLAALLPALDVDLALVLQLRHAGENLGDPNALFAAGYGLIDIGLGDLAVGPLAQALSLAQVEHILDELAIALDERGVPAEAAAAYQANRWSLSNDVCRAQLSHYAAMAGDLEETRSCLGGLGPDGTVGMFYRRGLARVSRYDAAQSIGRPRAGDLRGWELVLNGTVILATSDLDEEMNGRYAVLWDTPGMFATMLELLPRALRVAGKAPTGVVTAADRDSQIAAIAIAARLNLGAPTKLTADPLPSGSLVVAYDWSRCNQNELNGHAGEVVTFFGYSVNWVNSEQMAPDIAYLHAQQIYPPWGERMRLIGDLGGSASELVTIPADDRGVEEVAADISEWTPGADGGPEADLAGTAWRDSASADVAALIEATARGGGDIGLLGGHRDRFYPNGPVHSSFFI